MYTLESARMKGKRGAARLFRTVQLETLHEIIATRAWVLRSPLSTCMFYTRQYKACFLCKGFTCPMHWKNQIV